MNIIKTVDSLMVFLYWDFYSLSIVLIIKLKVIIAICIYQL